MFWAGFSLYLLLFVHGCCSEITRHELEDVLIEAVEDCQVYCQALNRHGDSCITELSCGKCITSYDHFNEKCAEKSSKQLPVRRNYINNQDNVIDNIQFREASQQEVNAAVNEPTTTTTKQTTKHTTHAPKNSAQKAGGGSGDTSSGFTTLPTPLFLAIVAGCSVAGMVGLVVAGVCWYRFQKDVKAASEVEYPAYGVTGPNKERVQSPGDRKLAQSAQMYHYQHQKQQMIALEKANGEMKHDASDEDSEEENEEGDYTVYECPGLAPTGEMEVKNPLFSEDSNNSTPPSSAGPTQAGPPGVGQAEK